MQRYVIDSSVFNKLFLDEADRDKAQQLFIQAAAGHVMLLAPDLLYLFVEWVGFCVRPNLIAVVAEFKGTQPIVSPTFKELIATLESLLQQ